MTVCQRTCSLGRKLVLEASPANSYTFNNCSLLQLIQILNSDLPWNSTSHSWGGDENSVLNTKYSVSHPVSAVTGAVSAAGGCHARVSTTSQFSKSYWNSSRGEAGATLVHTQEEVTSIWLLCLHKYATGVPGSLSAGPVPAKCVRKVTFGNSPATHNITPLSQEAWLKIWSNCLQSGHEKSLQPQKLIQVTIMLQTSLILGTLVNEENVTPRSDFFIPVN